MGCLSAAGVKPFSQARACLNSVLVPKNATPAVPFLGACFGTGDKYDGGTVYVAANNDVYAAYWNEARQRIDVFKNFVLMTQDAFLGVAMVGHPYFVPHTSIPTLAAPTATGH